MEIMTDTHRIAYVEAVTIRNSTNTMQTPVRPGTIKMYISTF